MQSELESRGSWLTPCSLSKGFLTCRATQKAVHSAQPATESKSFDMMTAVIPAATLSSFFTSLIEAPMEMFRHRVQVCTNGVTSCTAAGFMRHHVYVAYAGIPATISCCLQAGHMTVDLPCALWIGLGMDIVVRISMSCRLGRCRGEYSIVWGQHCGTGA